MSVTTKVLVPSKVVENALTSQYTVSKGTAIIDKFTAMNYGTTPGQLKVYLVASGDSAGDHNLVAMDTIPTGGTFMFPELVGHTLMMGGSISTIASVSSSINLRVSGREVT